VQRLGAPVNAMLKVLAGRKEGEPPRPKDPLYRNAYRSEDYLRILSALDVTESGACGMFPVPLISHSPAFPFSLMSPRAERRLVRIWERIMALRAWRGGDPWTCHERWGLAFLVWAKK
jgi:hypothetical protein